MPYADPDVARKQATIRMRRWRAAHPKPRTRVLLTDDERKQKAIANAKRWAMANPEKKKQIEERWRKKNPERLAVLVARARRRYKERHPHKLTEIWAVRRRAVSKSPVWGDKDRIRVVYEKARSLGFEVDHIVPLKHHLVSGLHVWHNLQLLDRPLNRSKRNRNWPDMPQITTGSSITEE